MDYRVEVKISNARIKRLMAARGFYSVAELCRAMDMPKAQTCAGQIINLKEAPINTRGAWRPIVIKMSEALGCLPEEMFSESQKSLSVKANKVIRDIEEGEIQLFIESAERLAIAPDELVAVTEMASFAGDILAGLTPRQERIMRMHYGLNGEREHSAKEIGEAFDLTAARVHQIIAKVERRLRANLNHRRTAATFFPRLQARLPHVELED